MGDAAEALERRAGMRRLDDHVVLSVSGEDAHGWLGGQVTNQVQTTTPGDAVYALFTNVKGKVLADAWILHVSHGDEDDLLYAIVPVTAREALLESFDKYIVMEDVDVAVRDDLAVLTVQGPDAGDVVGRVPDAAAAAWPCDRLGTGGRDVVLGRDAIDAVAEALREAGATPAAEAAWELARLRLAVPRFGADFDATSYPQEAGLSRRAVSFDKGCYVGQEVVCMLESRGKVSRRLAALELPSGAVPTAGAPIETDGKAVGHVTTAAIDPREQTARALGWLKATVAEVGRAVQIEGTDARITRIID